MTKQELIDLLDSYDEEQEIDLSRLAREIEREQAEEHERFIEELEERQHQSGFYSFQDELYNWRMER